MRTLFLGLTAMSAMIAVPAAADSHPRLVTGTQTHHDRGDGAGSLRELRERFWKEPERYLIKLSSSSRRESYDR